MVKVRSVAEFLHDFPDDCVEDEHDIVVYGGKNVTEALGQLIRGLGYRVSDPIDEGFKGWELSIRGMGRRFQLRYSDLPPVGVLSVWDVTFLHWSTRTSLAEFLLDLDAELRRDGRFHEIKWSALRSSPDEAPSERPVDD